MPLRLTRDNAYDEVNTFTTSTLLAPREVFKHITTNVAPKSPSLGAEKWGSCLVKGAGLGILTEHAIQMFYGYMPNVWSLSFEHRQHSSSASCHWREVMLDPFVEEGLPQTAPCRCFSSLSTWRAGLTVYSITSKPGRRYTMQVTIGERADRTPYA